MPLLQQLEANQLKPATCRQYTEESHQVTGETAATIGTWRERGQASPPPVAIEQLAAPADC